MIGHAEVAPTDAAPIVAEPAASSFQTTQRPLMGGQIYTDTTDLPNDRPVAGRPVDRPPSAPGRPSMRR